MLNILKYGPRFVLGRNIHDDHHVVRINHQDKDVLDIGDRPTPTRSPPTLPESWAKSGRSCLRDLMSRFHVLCFVENDFEARELNHLKQVQPKPLAAGAIDLFSHRVEASHSSFSVKESSMFI